MKTKLLTGLLAALFFSNICSADSLTKNSGNIPGGNEGTPLENLVPANVLRANNLPTSGCVVSMPDTNKTTPRVARVQARMAAWIGDQNPLNLEQTPRVWIAQKGDNNVILRGPAYAVENMGSTDMSIKDRDGSLAPMIGDNKGNHPHWIELNTPLKSNIAQYTDGKPNLEISKMSFRIDNARPTKKFGESTHRNADSYTVTALFINFLGQIRVYGICM